MDEGSAGEGAGAFQTVFQLTNVAGPVISQHNFDRFVAENFFLSRSARGTLHEVGDEKRDILATLAQRWDAQAENIKAEIQVAPESASGDSLLQVAVGGGQNTNVDGNAARASDGTDFFFLNGAQQFGLKVDGKFADFIEKYGSPFGDGQQSIFGLIGAR